ncbi:MAG: lipoyl(octanoyl) transferase LipB, partial [Candidatus Zixiibacteriota bacterium]
MTAAKKKQLFGWVLRLGRIDFERTRQWQLGLVKLRKEGLARDTIIFVEHPPVITVGKNGHRENFNQAECKPLFIERGGDVTYHGPGQLVIYFIFNLTRRGKDLHQFITNIQDGIITAFKEIGIETKRGSEYTGVWAGKMKIASIGVAVKNWISFHGAAVNLNTNLDDFKQINPCGFDAGIMTSANKILNKKIDKEGYKDQLLKA